MHNFDSFVIEFISLKFYVVIHRRSVLRFLIEWISSIISIVVAAVIFTFHVMVVAFGPIYIPLSPLLFT